VGRQLELVSIMSLSESGVASAASSARGANAESPGSGSPHRAASILLIEDDLEIALNVSRDLLHRGFEVSHAATAADGLAQIRRGAFDLLIIDRMLDDVDGLAILETMRAEASIKPVIVLSALSEPQQRVRGLRAGGDDYLTKPFDPEELAARIDALLRRTQTIRETELQVGALRLDLIERQAWRGAREIDLLPREFKLLEYLMRHHDQVVTRAMLLEDIWQYKFVPETNLVDVHIGKLRRKVDGPGEQPMILSVRRAGFMLSASA
jgi:two-component system OmpR family response regulator